MLFSHISHTPQPLIQYFKYRHLEHFKMILSQSNVFGSRVGATEILTIISVKNVNF